MSIIDSQNAIKNKTEKRRSLLMNNFQINGSISIHQPLFLPWFPYIALWSAAKYLFR